MPNIEILNAINSDGLDLEKLLLLFFENYEEQRKTKKIYHMPFEPEGLIRIYYQTVNEPKFNGLMEKFKKRYIKNECKLEDVHESCENEGLEVMYEYIHTFISTKNINIFTIMVLHQKLFSKVPYPEFGGSLRNRDVYLPGTFIETESYDRIPIVLNELYNPVNELVNEGIELGKNKNVDKIIDYIDKCIELNAQLIKIHPFMDGNGRVCRAFLNLLFKLAGVPPTYIRVGEKEEYAKAMNKAITENDLSVLKKFYYFKICDSIFELDIKEKLNNMNNEQPKIR